MAILRAPSQFSPAVAGGPVTPSCCGCSCCCCCVGSAVATSVALPMVLHQITRTRPDAAQPVQEPTGPGQDRANTTGRRVGVGRRVAGIVLAALTVPAVVMAAIAMQHLGGLAFIGAVTVAVVLGVGSYLLAGANPASSMATPLLIMLIGTAMAFGELFIWIVVLIDDTASKTAKTAAGVAIVAIPVITTVLLVLVGRHRRQRLQRG